jgi:ribonuclease R
LFPRRKDKKLEGEIIEIMERAKSFYVGTLQMSKNYAFLVADSKSMPVDIYIPSENLHGAKDGQKVIVSIAEWPANSKNPIGLVTEVLGEPGNNDVEMHAILAEYGLPLRFPPEIEAEAEKIPLK